MNPWHILDLAPTSNLRDIKRAYAKKLKLIDQETNPQDFLELRQAFEHAQYAAEVLRSAAESADFSDSDFWDDSSSNTSQDYKSDSPFVEYIPPSEAPQAIAFNIYDELNNDSNQDEPLAQASPQALTESNVDAISFNVYDKFKLVENSDHQQSSTKDSQQNTSTEQQDTDQNSQQNDHIKDDVEFIKPLDPYGKYLSYNVYEVLESFEDQDDDQNKQQIQDDFKDSPRQNLNQQNNDLPPPLPPFESVQNKSPFPNVDPTPLNEIQTSTFWDLSDDLDQNLEQETNEIIEFIGDYDFSEPVFIRFKKLLENLEHATLNQQLEIRERLRDSFAYLNLEEFNSKFGGFISLWYQHFPEEEDCLQQDYTDERLSQYANIYLKQDQIYQSLSPKLKIAFEDLLNDQKFRPLDILSLYSHMTKTMQIDSPIEFMKDIHVKNREKNANFLYLDLIENNWESIWWIVLNIAVGCFIQLIFDLSIIAHILIFIGMIIWHVLIQNSLTAFILSREKSDLVLLRLNQSWLVSGLILCATPYLFPTLLHQSFSFLWVMLSVTLFNCAQHLYPSPIKRLLFDAQKIKADGWVTSFIFMISIWGLSSLFSHGFDTSTIWMMSFCLIPIGFVLFNSFFYPLYLSFGYRLTAPEEFADYAEHKRYKVKQFFANLAFIIFRAIWVITAIYFLVDRPQDQYFFYLSLFSFMSMLLVGLNEKLMQYIFKYISYLVSIIVTILTVIPPLVLIFLFFKTVKLDRNANLD